MAANAAIAMSASRENRCLTSRRTSSPSDSRANCQARSRFSIALDRLAAPGWRDSHSRRYRVSSSGGRNTTRSIARAATQFRNTLRQGLFVHLPLQAGWFAALLHDMRQLMGEKVAAIGSVGAKPSRTEHDVAANGIGVGMDLSRRLRGGPTRMYPYPRKVRIECTLHVAANLRFQRHARLGERAMHVAWRGRRRKGPCRTTLDTARSPRNGFHCASREDVVGDPVRLGLHSSVVARKRFTGQRHPRGPAGIAHRRGIELVPQESGASTHAGSGSGCGHGVNAPRRIIGQARSRPEAT